MRTLPTSAEDGGARGRTKGRRNHGCRGEKRICSGFYASSNRHWKGDMEEEPGEETRKTNGAST